MINVSVRASNLVDLADQIEEGAKPLLLEAMNEASALFQADVQQRLRVRSATAAAAGESPHQHTAKLEQSIKVVKAKIRGRTVVGGIYTLHPAAALLEYGGIVLTKAIIAGLNIGNASRRRIKLALKAAKPSGPHVRPAHPYLRPSEMAMQNKIVEHLEEKFNGLG